MEKLGAVYKALEAGALDAALSRLTGGGPGRQRAARVLAAIDRSAVVLETDCPYMAPEPVRGRRNDSRNIAHVAAFIGTLWEMDAGEVLRLTANNARSVFGG